MPRILLLIPVSAVIIGSLVAFKMTRPRATTPSVPTGDALTLRRAPLFRLFDQDMQLVRLERTLGRQKMLIVFFDRNYGRAASPLLEALRDNFPRLHATGAEILAISAVLRLDQRKGLERDGPFPFPLLSDLDYDVHARWGALDAAKNRPLEAVFVVDRAGVIRHAHLGPVGLGTPDDWVRELKQAP